MLYGTPTYISVYFVPAHLVSPVRRSRDCHRPLLPMFSRLVQPRQSQRPERQVGTGGLHRRHVLDRHRIHRDE